MFVQEFDGQNDFSEKEPSVGQLKALIFLEVVEELSTRAQVNDEAVVVCSDERVVQID